MMTAKKHTDSPTGPLANLASVYCSQLDTGLKAGEPLLRGITRYQLEWTRLASRRTRAWATLPSSLAQCKTPTDVLSLNMQFWQTAALNYQESLQRMWALAGNMGAMQAAASDSKAANGHDHLEVRGERPAKAAGTASRHAA